MSSYFSFVVAVGNGGRDLGEASEAYLEKIIRLGGGG